MYNFNYCILCRNNEKWGVNFGICTHNSEYYQLKIVKTVWSNIYLHIRMYLHNGVLLSKDDIFKKILDNDIPNNVKWIRQHNRL